MHKTNVLTFAGDLWQRTFDEVAAEFPDVGTAYNHVDAATIYFVQDPQRYDVIVTDNLFGDILTDLGGAVSRRRRAGLVGEPQPGPHRPAHVRAGARLGARHRRHRASPTRRAAILSAALMLDFLGEGDAADADPRRVRRAGHRQHHGRCGDADRRAGWRD